MRIGICWDGDNGDGGGDSLSRSERLRGWKGRDRYLEGQMHSACQCDGAD